MSAQGLFSQNGVIKGQLLGENKKPLEMAAVVVDYGGQKIYSITDQKGMYTIKPLNSGTYNMTITCLGYKVKTITGIPVSADKVVMMNTVQMIMDSELIEGTEIIAYKQKLIDPEDVTRMTMVANTLAKLPDNKNLGAALRTMSSEVNISENNKDVIIRGSRSGESVCFVDGVKQRDFSNTIPGNAIGRIVMYTGGIPAKYGDITGGVVILETKSYFDLYNDYQATQISNESEKPVNSIEEEAIIEE
jgi:hypothetical protein